MLPKELSKLKMLLMSKRIRTNEENELLKELAYVDANIGNGKIEKRGMFCDSLAVAPGICTKCGRPL
jgi:hypothetical protein